MIFSYMAVLPKEK